MLSELVPFQQARFSGQEEVLPRLSAACSTAPDICVFEQIGASEEGRALVGIRLGNGPRRISLIAGAHSDEPVGPETLNALILGLLSNRGAAEDLLTEHTFHIVPHVNPDGEVRNRSWISSWPDVAAYLGHAFRELPGRDVEFCYPDRRVENTAVSSWLNQYGPFDLHMSLHGMGFSDGAMLLIERHWGYRTEGLQTGFTMAASQAGLRLHDHNRKGEKGFFSIAPGFTTTPEGAAMRTYFRSQGQVETANLFGDSSMEFVKSLGGDPLCLVTELPLFVVEGESEPGHPTAYLAFKSELPDMRLAVERGGDLTPWIKRYGLRPLPLERAVALQLRSLELGLETISMNRP